ncbi:MAG: 1-deoxy-D-xylulose-5-phosphate reductoisomerase [Rhodocyclaceae bacterium]|nr:1-deoxy-D-xylulose-5-phosphate reductoisomerase [Rhodocyclaceae bacterium]MBX3669419.1 1-deoxy-D-xylulose-5-phosphate reductoisomerase [Rhodocyclaceae bacterium]
MQNIAILGATGSIGASTIDVVLRHPDRFRVVALSAHSQTDKVVELASRLEPLYVALTGASEARAVRTALAERGLRTEVLEGSAGLEQIARAPEVDSVMSAIVGAAGLPPTLAAARAGKKILLANKESLVLAGGLLMAEVAAHAATLLPIDSEHNAVFQCMPVQGCHVGAASGVRRVLLTASGGPFRNTPVQELANVTPDQACAHPNWNMGRKISVDSATMMNKGLEVIEAHWLFDAPPDCIDVVIHPQSVIHSMVEYVDGSVLAQMGTPDMRTPIACALAWPQRIDAGVSMLDLAAKGTLTFERPDFERFPCLGLAYMALRAGGTAPAILNAANEVAVAAFLHGDVGFTGIYATVAETLERVPHEAADCLETVFAADRSARETARTVLAARCA